MSYSYCSQLIFSGIPGSLRITDRDYTDELADKTSTQYLELFNELRSLVSYKRTCRTISRHP